MAEGTGSVRGADGRFVATGANGAALRARTLTAKVCEAFLAHLAATAHVERSAAAAGIGLRTVYDRRQRDPVFAQQWRSALLAGYDRIEAALIRKALGLTDHAPVVDVDDTGVLEVGEIDVSIAVLLLSRHRPAVERAAKEVKEAAFRSSRDAAEATLLAKLKGYAKQQRIAAAEGAR